MKLLVIIALLLAIAFALVGCPKSVKVQPGPVDMEVGPVHKKIEINNKNNKRLFNIDVWEDPKNIKVKPGESEIRIR